VRYTAATLTAVDERPTIRVGRSDASYVQDKPFAWRARRWYTRTFRTWRPLAISTRQMLALQAAHARDPITYVLTLALVLRAVFPRRWWHRLTGDPVRLILRLGQQAPELQGRVLRHLVSVPGSTRDATKEPVDPLEAFRRDQRRAVYGEAEAAGGPTITLAAAAMTVRAEYGDAWYWNPERWPTSDGYVPFAVCLLEYAGLQAMDARRRLEVADGFALAHAKDPRRARMQLQKVAYPAEAVH
jgi:hypothetical protein